MAGAHTGWSVDHSCTDAVIEISSILVVSPETEEKPHMPVVMSAAPMSSGATQDEGTMKDESLITPRSNGSSDDSMSIALALANIQVERAKAKAAEIALNRAEKLLKAKRSGSSATGSVNSRSRSDRRPEGDSGRVPMNLSREISAVIHEAEETPAAPVQLTNEALYQLQNELRTEAMVAVQHVENIAGQEVFLAQQRATVAEQVREQQAQQAVEYQVTSATAMIAEQLRAEAADGLRVAEATIAARANAEARAEVETFAFRANAEARTCVETHLEQIEANLARKAREDEHRRQERHDAIAREAAEATQAMRAQAQEVCAGAERYEIHELNAAEERTKQIESIAQAAFAAEVERRDREAKLLSDKVAALELSLIHI